MSILLSLLVSALFYGYNQNVLFALALGLQVWSIINLAYAISVKIPLFEFMLYQYIFSVIFMPIIGYTYYDKDTEISKLIGWYMKVPYQEYYKITFVLMIVIIFATYILDSSLNKKNNLLIIFNKFKENKEVNNKLGKYLFYIGILGIVLFGKVGPLNYFAYLCKLSFFISPIFLYYSHFKYKKHFMLMAILIFLGESISSGMFGEFLLYIMAMISVITFNMKVNRVFVSLLLVLSFVLMTFLQMVKPYYRAYTWSYSEYSNIKKVDKNKLILFLEIGKEVFINRKALLTIENMYGPYSRFNQGLILSMVYDYIPRVKEHLKGERLLLLIGGILTPRFLWPDKPQAGGRFNMINFAGYTPRANTSINIGPIGEAYGNFGILGGVIFLFAYFFIICALFKHFIIKCKEIPVLWGFIPLIFYGVMATQSEMYEVLNGLFKSLIFLYILGLGFKVVYKINLWKG